VTILAADAHFTRTMVLAVVVLLAGCASDSRQPVPSLPERPAEKAAKVPAATAPALHRQGIELASLPGWESDDLAELGSALNRQCQVARSAQRWPELCGSALPADTASLRNWLERNFRAWPLAGPDGSADGLITGYYEPLLTGSLGRESPTQTPVYTLPGAAERSRTLSRSEIEVTGLPIARVLLWLDDPVDAFFLHVQGSGRVRLRDGSLLRIGFAGHNGQRYVPIGRVLVERGELRPEDADMQGIRRWLREHLASDPQSARAVMRANPRYIFFRKLGPLAEDAGPPGSLGVPLTARRSVATDPAAVPPGSLLFLATTLPRPGNAAAAPFARVVVNQDTGAAIVGQVRADLFTGTGTGASELAGRMRQRGQLWLLWPENSLPPISRNAR